MISIPRLPNGQEPPHQDPGLGHDDHPRRESHHSRAIPIRTSGSHNRQQCPRSIREFGIYHPSPTPTEIPQSLDPTLTLQTLQDTIITVLPEPHHVQNVFQQMLKPPTLLTSTPVQRERLFIDCSTIDPLSSASVAEATHCSGQGKFIDAPMSGGVVGAAAGKLTFMLGAADDLVEQATAILSHMGKRVVHLGPQTSGLKGKLANNYLLALNNIATAEAMNMGVKWGLDPKALADMINTATGKCWPSEVNNPVPGVIEGAPAGNGYEGGFGTSLMLKDLRLALEAATQAGVVPQLGLQAKEIYTAVEADEGLRGKDFSVVYRYIGGVEPKV